jgi:hypothetical protein
VIDTNYENIYLTHAFGISVISTSTWQRTLITGKDDLASQDGEEAIDGSFENAAFKSEFSRAYEAKLPAVSCFQVKVSIHDIIKLESASK